MEVKIYALTFWLPSSTILWKKNTIVHMIVFDTAVRQYTSLAPTCLLYLKMVQSFMITNYSRFMTGTFHQFFLPLLLWQRYISKNSHTQETETFDCVTFNATFSFPFTPETHSLHLSLQLLSLYLSPAHTHTPLS